MTISFVNIGSTQLETVTVSPLTVSYHATVTTGNLLIMLVQIKYSDVAPSTPAGWDLVTSRTGGLGSPGNDAGSIGLYVYKKIATGSETGTVSITLSGGTLSTAGGTMLQYSKTTGTWDTASTSGVDATGSAASWSATGDADPGVTAGDMVLVLTSINGNLILSWTSHSLTQTGVTFGSAVERFDDDTTSGTDHVGVISEHPASSGTSSAAPVYTMSGTGTPSTNSPTGPTVFLRLREASGTQYNQSVSGGITPSGALSKQAGKILSGSITPAGAILRQVNKILSGANTPTGTVTKQTSKTFSGAISSIVGTLAKQANKSFSGAVSSIVGTISRQANKVTGGTLTSSGALIRDVAKILAGSLTSSGALSKLTSKTFAGTLTSAGALQSIRLFVKAIGGTLTSSGALVLSTAKVIVGTLTPSGTVNKSTTKTFTGTVLSSGALAKTTAKTFSGALNFSGALSRMIGKVITGAIASAGAISRAVNKTLSGVLSSVGSLATETTAEGASYTPTVPILKAHARASLTGARASIRAAIRKIIGS